MVWSCHSKESVEEPDPRLVPPLGIAFTLDHGTRAGATYFNLSTMRAVLSTDSFPNYAIMASVVNLNESHVVITDAGLDRVSLMRLPDLLETHHAQLAGEPMDVEVDFSAGHIYAVTRNGDLYIDSVANGAMDTLELDLFPRRLTLRPPERNEAWVTCVGSQTVRIVNLSRSIFLDTLTFTDSPTDVQFSPDGATAFVALGGSPGSVAAYSASTRELLGNYAASGHGPCELAVSDDGKFLAASDSLAGTVEVWDIPTNVSWSLQVGHGAGVLCFGRQSHNLFVLVRASQQIKRIRVGQGGPEGIDSLQFSAALRSMALWEGPH